MKISLGIFWVIFPLASLSCAAESSNPFAACKEGNTEYIRQYIEHGGDPNAKTAPLPVPVFEGHSGTLLGMAVISNHVDIVQLLLDHGADPNLPTMGCTPLYLNLMNIKELATPPPPDDNTARIAAGLPALPPGTSSRYIADEKLQEAALAPLKSIRDMLVAHGAVSDQGPFRRRQLALNFRKFLNDQQGHVIFALCKPDQITFNHSGIIQQYDLPANVQKMSVWIKIEKIMAEWLDTQKEVEYLHIAIIGPSKMEFSVLRMMKSLCKDKNIPVSLFVIPGDTVSCDATEFFDLFTNPASSYSNPNKLPTDDFCPAPPRGYDPATEARLLAL